MKSKNKQKFLFFVLISLTVILMDRLTKYVLKEKTFPVIKNIFHITFVKNTGSAFGLVQKQWVIISLSLIVIFFIMYYFKEFDKKTVVPVSLVFGGVVSNLFDRVFYGYVIDFLDFRIWPVFNIADACITIGAIVLVYYLIEY